MKQLETGCVVKYDYVLIDSRNGLGDIPAICTVDLPDAIAACFTLNPQSIDGTAKVISHISKSDRARIPVIFPVPMRIENAERKRRAQLLKWARARFDPFLDHIQDRETYWQQVAFPYQPFYSYGEMLYAAIEDEGSSLLASSESVVSYLTNGEVRSCVPIVLPHEREYFLTSYDENSLA